MAAGPLLAQLKGLRLSLGGAPLFDDVSISLHKGECACLVGANGAGKSTLMRMLVGAVEADAGEISIASGSTLALVEQTPDLSGFATLRAYVQAAGAAPAHRADAELAALDLDPDRAPLGLSGGETRRASLARAFAADPDILLLDEPTNHLDIPAIEALEERIRRFSGAVLIISHDRRFLECASSVTFWLRDRRVLKLERGYAHFEEWAARVEAEEARALAKLETHLKAEEHWLRRGVTARRSRNEGRRRKLEALRAERRARQSAGAARAAMASEAAGASGRLVIEAQDVEKAFGARRVIRDFSVRIMRGDRVGIIGSNGAGKTTLLDILLRKTAPDRGSVRHGANLEIAHIDQTRAVLNPNDTIWEALAPLGGDQVMVHGRPRHVASYAKDFLFEAAQLRQPIHALSGGERNRVALACALAKPSNLLVLDEPTNDLDMETLDALEDMIADYAGTVLIVSHDRAFLDGVATQVIGALGDGRWAETPGGYADFEREHPRTPARQTRTAAALPAAEPPRSTPRKLSYKDERRFAELAAEMDALQEEIVRLEHRLADGSLFAKDPAGFSAAAAGLQAARIALDRVETEWLEIDARRDALIAGQPGES